MVKNKRVMISLAVILGLAVIFLPGITKLNELNDRKETLQNRIRELEARNRELEIEIKKMKEDPIYIEKVAREKFRAVREGEITYKIEQEK